MKQTTIYYVRHGQTVFNLQRRIQGKCDSPLTEKGLNDAVRAESVLRVIPFDRAYCSSSERCIDTAAILLRRQNISARPMKELKEFDYGSFDGCLMEPIAEELERRKREESFWEIGGDSRESIGRRIRLVFNRIADSSLWDDRVLVVSHGSFGMHTLNELFGLDMQAYSRIRKAQHPDQFAFPNCGIMKMRRREGVWELLELPCEPEEFTDRTEALTDYPRV